MKFESLTPLTPAPGQESAPVCVDGVCEIPAPEQQQSDSSEQSDE